MCIKHDNDLYRIVEAQHKTPGNLRGMVQAKIRNLKTGSISDHRFRSVDMVERAILDETEMEYLYQRRRHVPLHEQRDLRADGALRRGPRRRGRLPDPEHQARDRVLRGPPGRDRAAAQRRDEGDGDRARRSRAPRVSNVGKPAKMETGLIVQVPAFINEGDVIRIDTATGSYVERVNK